MHSSLPVMILSTSVICGAGIAAENRADNNLLPALNDDFLIRLELRLDFHIMLFAVYRAYNEHNR